MYGAHYSWALIQCSMSLDYFYATDNSAFQQNEQIYNKETKMTLNEKIAEDMKSAMKSGQKTRLETLRTIRAQLLEKEVERRPSGKVTPDDELAVLSAASKKRKEAIDIYRTHGKNDMADQEEQELLIIQEYMPKQVSADEVENIVKKIITQVNAGSAKDFGKVMSAVMKELKGRADGKLIQEKVKQLLPE